MVVVADLDAAVLRQTLLGDIELRHDLEPRRDRVAELHRRVHDAVEHAVDAVPDPVLLLVRFDVNVAGAFLHRRHQQHVDQPDDRRFLALPHQRVDTDLLEVAEHLHVGISPDRHLVEHARGHLECAFAGRLGHARVVLLDGLLDGRLGRHHGLDVVARHELDVVHGEHVGGIGHRDRERRTRAAQRDHLVLLRRLDRDQFDDRGIDLELREVDGRHAILPAQQGGDVFAFHEAQLHQGRSQLPSMDLLVCQSFLELFRCDAPLFEEQLADAYSHVSCLTITP